MSQTNPRTWPRKTVVDLRTRSAAFREFKCMTGDWPVLSAGLYAGRFLFALLLISILFWYGRQHAGEVNRVGLYTLLGSLPVIFVWNIVETLVWNHELRRRALISRGMYVGLTQLPSR
jgi:hypothetical protein